MLAAALQACASVPLAPETADQSAKTFRAPPGRANVYVYRPDTFVLSALKVNVKVNGSSFGLTKVGTYLHAAVEPGQYTLISESEAEIPVILLAEAGKNYFFQQEVAFGSNAARTSLVRVDEKAGRDAVLDSVMAASQAPRPAASTAPTGCTRDTECKGNRVCNAGSCVDPPTH